MLLILFGLYCLGMLLAGLAGFCDAAGRIGLIFKKRYYIQAVQRALLWSQLTWPLAGVGFALGYALSSDASAYFLALEQAGRAALWIYASYTSLVALTFLGYAIPHTEARSLVTVALFGPLTLLLPVVVLTGFFAAIYTHPHPAVFAFFAPCTLYMLFFKRLLGRFRAWQSSLPPALRPPPLSIDLTF